MYVWLTIYFQNKSWCWYSKLWGPPGRTQGWTLMLSMEAKRLEQGKEKCPEGSHRNIQEDHASWVSKKWGFKLWQIFRILFPLFYYFHFKWFFYKWHKTYKMLLITIFFRETLIYWRRIEEDAHWRKAVNISLCLGTDSYSGPTKPFANFEKFQAHFPRIFSEILSNYLPLDNSEKMKMIDIHEFLL